MPQDDDASDLFNTTVPAAPSRSHVPVGIATTNNLRRADAEFAINRKDFGLVYPGKPDDLIRDDVVIRLAIRSRKQS